MKGVYETFGLPMPVIYPRKSVTIVEKKIDHILKKYRSGASRTSGATRTGRSSETSPRKQIPDALGQALRLVRDHLGDGL